MWGWALPRGVRPLPAGAGGRLWGRGWPLYGAALAPLLQLLKMETDRLVVLVSGTFPEPGDAPLTPAPLSQREQQLCQQIRATATSIQVGPEPCHAEPCHAEPS